MFTVSRLGIDGRLAKTLTTSTPVDSMISIARTTNRNVTNWRDGHMVLRWTAAGMLNAERSFRRIKGYKQMPQLIAALNRHAHPEPQRPPKLSVPPPSVHLGSPPKFHGTRDMLNRSRQHHARLPEQVAPTCGAGVAIAITGSAGRHIFAARLNAVLIRAATPHCLVGRHGWNAVVEAAIRSSPSVAKSS